MAEKIFFYKNKEIYIKDIKKQTKGQQRTKSKKTVIASVINERKSNRRNIILNILKKQRKIKKMIIGISIDGVLRNLFGKMEESHMKYFPKDENEEDTKILDYDFEKWLIFPEEEVKQGEMEFNPEFNEKKFIEENSDTVLTKKIEQVTIEECLYEKCTL